MNVISPIEIEEEMNEKETDESERGDHVQVSDYGLFFFGVHRFPRQNQSRGDLQLADGLGESMERMHLRHVTTP